MDAPGPVGESAWNWCCRVYVRGLRARTPASVARVGTEKAPPSPRIETGKRKRM